MAFLGKTYTYVKHEKFDEWLKAVANLPEDKVNGFLAQKPTQKIVQNGDSYTVTQSFSKGDKSTTFKSGVEFDDTIGEENHPIKTTYTVDGNVVTQVIKSGDGSSATFKKEFNGDDLVVTITSDKYDGVAKRYYKA